MDRRRFGLVNINGAFCSSEEARVSVFDHGFLYGDSVYEVMSCHEGVPFALDRHLLRLTRSAERLHMDSNVPSHGKITEEIKKSFVEYRKRFPQLNNNCYMRLIVTRGVGDISFDPAVCEHPTVIIILLPLPVFPAAYYQDGIQISLVSVKRNLREAVDPAIKSGNYLNNVLAYMEAKSRGAIDAVMTNSEGYLTEMTAANILIVKNGAVLTPRLESGILEGVTRGLIKEICSENGISFVEKNMLPEELFGADEAFITGTLKEIMPVYACDDKKIGTQCPGPVVKRITDLFKDRMKQMLAEDRKHFRG